MIYKLNHWILLTGTGNISSTRVTKVNNWVLLSDTPSVEQKVGVFKLNNWIVLGKSPVVPPEFRMSKRLSDLMTTEVKKDVLHPVLFAEFFLETTTIRVWSGVGDFVWGNRTWKGMGLFGKVSAIEESVEVKSTSATFQLSAIPSNLLGEIMQYQVQGKQVVLYFGVLNDVMQLIETPIILLIGLIDQVEITDGATTSSINLTTQNRLRDLERQRTRRYTNEDQKVYYPTDTFMRYLSLIQDSKTDWGVLT